jgi:hypothetical protein
MLKQLVSAPSISAAGGAQGGKGGHTQDIVPTAGVCMCACVCMSDRVSVCKCFVVQVYVCMFVHVLTPHTCKGVLRSILVQGNKRPAAHACLCVCVCMRVCMFILHFHKHTHTYTYSHLQRSLESSSASSKPATSRACPICKCCTAIYTISTQTNHSRRAVW